MSYSEEITRLISALENLPDLNAAQAIVQDSLPLLRDLRFLPTFLSILKQPTRTEVDNTLVYMALHHGLEKLVPEDREPQIQVIALAFSEEGLDKLYGRFERHITLETCERLGQVADAIEAQADLPIELAQGMVGRLRSLAKVFSDGLAHAYIRPLIELARPEGKPDDLLQAIVQHAQSKPNWLFPAYQRFADGMRESTSDPHGLIVAAIAEGLVQAHHEVESGSDPKEIFNLTRTHMGNRLGEWILAASNESTRRTLSSFGSWLVWGPEAEPPKPFAMLSRIKDIHSPKDAWQLVKDEPWFLSSSGLNTLQHLQEMGPSTSIDQPIEWLQDLSSRLITPDENPLVRLAHQVREKQIQPETAEEQTRQLVHEHKVEVPHLAAIDAWIYDQLLDQDPTLALDLARLNQIAAKTLPNRLMQGYASLTIGIVGLDHYPMAQVVHSVKQAIAIARELDHSLLLAESLEAQGQGYASQDRFDEALSCFQQARQVAQRLPPGTGMEELELATAQVYLQMWQPEQALKHLNYLERDPESLEQPLLTSYRYWYLRGEAEFQRGNLNAGLQVWEKARYLAQSMQKSRFLNEITRGLANAYARGGNEAKAQELLGDLESTGTPELQVEALETRATLALSQGEWAQGKDLLQQALMRAQQEKLTLRELAFHGMLGYLYNRLELFSEAQVQWQACHQILNKIGGFPRIELSVKLDESNTLSGQGNHNGALKVCREALHLARRMDDLEGIEAALTNLVAIYVDLKHFERALALTRVAQPQVSVSGRRTLQSNQASILANMGKRAWAKRHRRKARELFRQAEDIWQHLVEEEQQTRHLEQHLYHLGLLFQEPAVRDPVRAWHYLHAAVGTAEKRGVSLAAETLWQHFLERRVDLYQAALEAALTANDQCGAVEMAEVMRAHSLRKRISELEAFPSSVPPAMRQAHHQALVRFRITQNVWLGQEIMVNRFTRGISTSFASSSPERGERLFATYQEAKQELDRQVEAIRQTDPGFHPVDFIQLPKYDDIHDLLREINDPKLALVHLQVMANDTIALISTLRNEEPEIVRLPLSYQQIRIGIRLWEGPSRGWERVLGQPVKSLRELDISMTPDKVESTTHVLGRTLWKNLHRNLQALGIKRVVLMPDNLLSILPIHIAPLEETKAKGNPPEQWVSDVYDVAFAPSVEILRLLKRRAEMRRDVLHSGSAWAQVGGTNFAAVAAGIVLDYLANTGEIVWDTESNRQQLQRASENRTLLHVHAHGRYNVINPSQTTLEMPYERNVQGVPLRDLTLSDVSQSFLMESNRLTVLAACESSAVELARLSEFNGLPAAFLMAGAPAVLAALWSVDELATLLLLRRFYVKLSKGRSIVRALRQAQNNLRKTRRDRVEKELMQLQKDCKRWAHSYKSDTALSAFSRSGFALGDSINRLRRERESLARLRKNVHGLKGEALEKVVLTEIRNVQGDQDKEWSNRLEDLWLRLKPDKWDSRAVQEWLLEREVYPFSEPYFWGGFQAWGAVL